MEGLNAKLQQLTTDLREQSFAGGQSAPAREGDAKLSVEAAAASLNAEAAATPEPRRLDGSAFGTPTPPSPQVLAALAPAGNLIDLARNL